ncbi:MAG: hypothetical protein ACUZ8E_12080 [Candidatus Anammoxibacter sp.]
MVKRYLLAGIGVVFFCVSSVFAETEIILKNSTSASGFSVKDSSGNTIMRVVRKRQRRHWHDEPFGQIRCERNDFSKRSTIACGLCI